MDIKVCLVKVWLTHKEWGYEKYDESVMFLNIDDSIDDQIWETVGKRFPEFKPENWKWADLESPHQFPS